ncbi:BTAD domain-containing putative transcriptional regulator [Streptomyces diastatochromogenes]|nr:BTAD domain-containing putative transcriptional regulator [Streptomyces diastatochromogenes]
MGERDRGGISGGVPAARLRCVGDGGQGRSLGARQAVQSACDASVAAQQCGERGAVDRRAVGGGAADACQDGAAGACVAVEGAARGARGGGVRGGAGDAGVGVCAEDAGVAGRRAPVRGAGGARGGAAEAGRRGADAAGGAVVLAGAGADGDGAQQAAGGCRRGLEEMRLASVEALAEAYGQLGEHGRAAAVLRTEAVAHPLRESLAAALMLALARSGRQSDAIDWYHRTRRLLAEELGVDPGETLSEAYATLLRSAEPVSVPRPAVEVRAPAPEGLPRAPRGFTGRGAELAALDRAVRAGDGPVCLVTGPAGVGKTAFAVHWAYERRADFPDGRLFADLRGFSDTAEPETAAVLREFLLALGVAPQKVPETVDARGALFRSLTGGRRLLVVLDNARSSEQVRPLLPGGDHCATLITSRDRLGGLIASDAARPVPLGLLQPAASAALLTTVLGEERVAAEPAAAARLARLCDGLPLALRVTAARLAERPQWTLDAMVGELADEQGRLALLDVEDRGVSAALRLTVQQLPESAARMFRAVGLHTGSDLDRFAAGALAGTTPGQASADLDRLAAAHLLTEAVPGRWTPHDLVRLYARHLAPQADPEGLPGSSTTTCTRASRPTPPPNPARSPATRCPPTPDGPPRRGSSRTVRRRSTGTPPSAPPWRARSPPRPPSGCTTGPGGSRSCRGR